MKMQPSITELRALAAVARHRSFRKAADELELAPSTVSHLLTGFEARIGARLLNRTTRSVALTPVGERLVDRLNSILMDLDGALADVDAAREQPVGVLRITASDTVAMLLMRSIVPTFLASYPQITLDLVAEASFLDIVAEGYDAGIRLGEAVPRDMIAVRFGGPSRMLAVASPAYLRGRDPPVTPYELAAHCCVRSRTPAGRPYRWEFERHGEAVAVDVSGQLMLNRTELMVEAALKGLGISFVPARIAEPSLREGALIPLLEEWCPEYPGLFLFYPGHRHVPPVLRAFIDILKAHA
ncbi:LysR family transcriptional regulator [Methylobacterium variabile]|uniref:LysR family transcriptional regulator n=1 Tax=Methylobacterium variabile TaxID=298794 RepID=UPI0009F8D290|nr:LysR family transcriptional regulator [Methylobacterium variabile]